MPVRTEVEGLKAAMELTKQIITLSTGVIAITVTFYEKFGTHESGTSGLLPLSIQVAWISFGLTILSSIWTLAAITGTLDCVDQKANGRELSEYQKAAVEKLSSGRHIRIPGLAMYGFFMVGMFFTIASGWNF